MNNSEELRRLIAGCPTNTIVGAILKQAIIDININIKSKSKNNYKISSRRSMRSHAINYLMSDLCRMHCDIIHIDYDCFIEKVSTLIEKSKRELILSYQQPQNQNEKNIKHNN